MQELENFGVWNFHIFLDGKISEFWMRGTGAWWTGRYYIRTLYFISFLLRELKSFYKIIEFILSFILLSFATIIMSFLFNFTLQVKLFLYISYIWIFQEADIILRNIWNISLLRRGITNSPASLLSARIQGYQTSHCDW